MFPNKNGLSKSFVRSWTDLKWIFGYLKWAWNENQILYFVEEEPTNFKYRKCEYVEKEKKNNLKVRSPTYIFIQTDRVIPPLLKGVISTKISLKNQFHLCFKHLHNYFKPRPQISLPQNIDKAMVSVCKPVGTVVKVCDLGQEEKTFSVWLTTFIK